MDRHKAKSWTEAATAPRPVRSTEQYRSNAARIRLGSARISSSSVAAGPVWFVMARG